MIALPSTPFFNLVKMSSAGSKECSLKEMNDRAKFSHSNEELSIQHECLDFCHETDMGPKVKELKTILVRKVASRN